MDEPRRKWEGDRDQPRIARLSCSSEPDPNCRPSLLFFHKRQNPIDHTVMELADRRRMPGAWKGLWREMGGLVARRVLVIIPDGAGRSARGLVDRGDPGLTCVA